MFYVSLSEADAINLNEILYHELVTEDGVNFKFPFQAGTTRYINCQSSALGNGEHICQIDQRVLDLAENNSEVNTLISNKKTRQEAVDSGWIIEHNLNLYDL